MTTFFLMMTLHPDVQQRAQAEIDRVIGRNQENMLSTGNEVRRTSLANHPPMWSKCLNGQCHQVLPGLSVFRAYDNCYFVVQVPKKVVL
jgi:hypothetical protein